MAKPPRAQDRPGCPKCLKVRAGPDDKAEKIKKIQKDIADQKAKLAELEKELAALTGSKPLDPNARQNYAGPKVKGDTLTPPTVGDIGNFGDYEYYVEEIIDEDSALLSIGRPQIKFLVRGVSTKGLTDDIRVKMTGVWEISKTEKFKGKTYILVIGRESQGLSKP